MKSIQGQRYNIIQINYIAGILNGCTTYAEDPQLSEVVVETLRYTLFTICSVIEFKSLTPPIHACAVS